MQQPWSLRDRERRLRRILSGFLSVAAALVAGSCDGESRLRPNIVLMMVEDLRPRIGAFGGGLARTPHLDRLVREDMRYKHFSPPLAFAYRAGRR